MNIVQVIRKARLGCDAILPSGQPSTLWQDDELVDLVTEANDDLNLALRLVRKKWGVQTVLSTTPAFSRDGELYDPTVQLNPASGATSVLLPPDFGEITRILCTSVTTVRFVPADFESQYTVDMEQGARNQDGTFTSLNSSVGMTYYYDIIGDRTLYLTPPLAGALALQIDYTPMKRPLFWTNTGTVTITQGSKAIAGAGTAWVTEGIYAGNADQRAELLVGVTSLSDQSIRLDRDYPTVATLTDNGNAILTSTWPYLSIAASPFILAMVPTLPRVYHRWIARVVATLMLSKINPDLSEKYAAGVMRRFDAAIRPTAGVRQIQESTVTDDNVLLGGLADF